MTPRTYGSILIIAVVLASFAGAFAVEEIAYGAGSAAADATPLDAGAVIVPALVDAGPDTGSAAVTAPPVTSPAPAPVVEPDPQIANRLWRSGAFLDAGIVLLYLLLGLWKKLDKNRAFYATAGLAALATVIETAVRGQTPTAAMLTGAATTLVAILLQGPARLAVEKTAEKN